MGTASARRSDGATPIDSLLQDLATLLRCMRCGARRFAVSADAVTCASCGHGLPVVDGVLHARSGEEDPAIERERQAVLDLEAAAPRSPTGFSMARLLGGPCPLRTAFLSLPYDDGSAFFRENEYFRNVTQFADTFDAVVSRLDLPAGSRVLDVGADLTWSTARLAARGWRPVAIDINHHLAASRVFREQGLQFAAVNADMHAPAFADGVFDGVTSFNALHHTHRLGPLVANLSRVLRPGGRLAFIEPYWYHEHNRATFGASQIEAGINENVYRLEEWHLALVNYGLEPVSFIAAASFHGVYEKRAAAAPPRTLTLEQARDDLFGGYYQSEVSAPAAVELPVARGAAVTIPVVVHNRSRAGWSPQSQLYVHVSYHLYRRGAASGHPLGDRKLVAFDNARTPLAGQLDPGSEMVVPLRVTAPIEPGDYVIEVDLVHEGVTWFADRGGRTAMVALRVE